jgi:carboxyl-terminal processing protease
LNVFKNGIIMLINPAVKPKKVMKMKSLVFLSVIGVMGGFLFFNKLQSPPSNPAKEAVLIKALLEGLQSMHYQPKAIDDAFSQNLHKLYLEEIDGAKRFLTQTDVAQLDKFSKQLDDQALAGTFEYFDLSAQMLDGSLKKAKTWYVEILAQPMTFVADEKIETDGKKLKWAKDDNDLKQRWVKSLKFEVLDYISDETAKQEKADFKGTKKNFTELEIEARKKTTDKYERWFKRLDRMDRTDRMEVYLNSITNIFDPHTGYFSPKEKENFDIQMSGKLEGIGARLQSNGEKTTVTEVVAGGPAWKGGQLAAEDVIEKVQQEKEEPLDIMGWEIDEVVQKVRGPKGTKVILHVRKADGSTKQIEIVRDVVIMEEGFAKSLIFGDQTKGESKIGYIFLPKFYADFTPSGTTSCAVDVEKEVAKLNTEGVDGIILDLRGNGGGSLRDVVRMSGLFIEKGPIVQVKSRAAEPEILSDRDTKVQYGGPLIVMVNGFSASASEILAAALQDYKRALVVGSAVSYGKGTVQRFLDLDQVVNTSDEIKPLGEMKLTVQKFYRITGKTTQLDGVVPDITLPDTYNYLEIGERDQEYPLASTTISPVAFSQSAYILPSVDELRTRSKARVSQSTTFSLIEENSKRFKRQKDETGYDLNLDKYNIAEKGRQAENKRFEDMLKPIDAFTIMNASADAQVFAADTSRNARNTDFIKDRKKDVQLWEAVQIMNDMIELDGIAIKKD